MRSEEAAPSLDGVGWYEYPVGFVGELARAFWRTLMAFLVGVGITFALVFAVGLIAEEGLVDYRLAETLDLLMRMSLGILMGVGYLAWLGLSVAVGLRETTTSKALDAAAASGANRSAVPHPGQVEDVVTPPFGYIMVFAGWNIGIGCLAILGGVGTLAEHDEAWFLLLGGTTVVATLIGVIYLVTRKTRPEHDRRRARIAQHWPTEYEAAAWSSARNASKQTIAPDTIDQGHRLKLAGRLTHLGSSLAGLALLLVYGYMFIRFPQANRASGMAEAGPRAEYGETFESLLDSAMWVFAGCAVVAVAMFLVGALIEGSAHSTERAGLRRALEDPTAPRPAGDLLARYSERHPTRLAQVAAALGGMGLIVATAASLLGTVELEDFSGGVDAFAGITPIASGTIAVSVVLIIGALIWNAVTNVRGQKLRNQLMHRWPTLPPEKPDSDGNVKPARKGPALTPN